MSDARLAHDAQAATVRGDDVLQHEERKAAGLMEWAARHGAGTLPESVGPRP